MRGVKYEITKILIISLIYLEYFANSVHGRTK